MRLYFQCGKKRIAIDKETKIMKDTLKEALEYAMAREEGAPRIKKLMEEFLASAGYDRRRKVRWGTDNCNKHYFSGIFWYAGEKYYFASRKGKVEELERIRKVAEKWK